METLTEPISNTAYSIFLLICSVFGFWAEAKGRRGWEEECRQSTHYTVHLGDTCTLFRSVSSDPWLFALSLSQPPEIHSWAVSLAYGLHIIMHIPFYTALKWWDPGSLPAYLNKPQWAGGGGRSGAEEGMWGGTQHIAVPVPTSRWRPGPGGTASPRLWQRSRIVPSCVVWCGVSCLFARVALPAQGHFF